MVRNDNCEPDVKLNEAKPVVHNTTYFEQSTIVDTVTVRLIAIVADETNKNAVKLSFISATFL